MISKRWIAGNVKSSHMLPAGNGLIVVSLVLMTDNRAATFWDRLFPSDGSLIKGGIFFRAGFYDDTHVRSMLLVEVAIKIFRQIHLYVSHRKKLVK